ncbi:MAG: hypothetical protein GWP61_11680 [Chloroflexi bacterium]|nr:hypothetical protein [Chloroflexota bacterium]
MSDLLENGKACEYGGPAGSVISRDESGLSTLERRRAIKVGWNRDAIAPIGRWLFY